MPIRLLDHQETVVRRVVTHDVLSISMPRRNGKTVAAIAAAIKTGGRVLFLSRTDVQSEIALETAVEGLSYAESVESTSTSVTWKNYDDAGGTITFAKYSKRGKPGSAFDTLIFDDADEVSDQMIAIYHRALFAGGKVRDDEFRPRMARIVALSVAPDRGLAALVHRMSEEPLQWASEDVGEANPGIPMLIPPNSLNEARRVLPTEIFRREHLGLAA